MLVWGTMIGIWTILQLKTMYDDRKRDLVRSYDSWKTLETGSLVLVDVTGQRMLSWV